VVGDTGSSVPRQTTSREMGSQNGCVPPLSACLSVGCLQAESHRWEAVCQGGAPGLGPYQKSRAEFQWLFYHYVDTVALKPREHEQAKGILRRLPASHLYLTHSLCSHPQTERNFTKETRPMGDSEFVIHSDLSRPIWEESRTAGLLLAHPIPCW
jgi:hypothetical protein